MQVETQHEVEDKDCLDQDFQPDEPCSLLLQVAKVHQQSKALAEHEAEHHHEAVVHAEHSEVEQVEHVLVDVHALDDRVEEDDQSVANEDQEEECPSPQASLLPLVDVDDVGFEAADVQDAHRFEEEWDDGHGLNVQVAALDVALYELLRQQDHSTHQHEQDEDHYLEEMRLPTRRLRATKRS